MTILILILFAVQILNVIHHLTVIEQLKEVKRIQYDFLDCLGDIDCDMITLQDELKDIRQAIKTLLETSYNNRNQ